jgi:NAD(P)-dependent dehydrogenase (short-subunit alcohol dehydrogenase family)
MARILITGSSDGLGSLTARALVKRGHSVVLHARNDQRAHDARSACPDAETCVVADLSDISQTKKLAEDINRLGAFDTVIHNAGLYTGPYRKTKEGWPSILAVNTLSPYILTCLIKPRPKRLVFVSSGLHSGGDASCKDITWQERGERGFRDFQAYSDTKLHDILLACFFAKKWPDVQSNSLDPGWVATKMGGAGATGDIHAAVDTYVMLAEGSGKSKDASGKYWYHCEPRSPKREANEDAVQQNLIKQLEEFTGVSVPDS